MEAGTTLPDPSHALPAVAFEAPADLLEPCAPRELRALVHAGETDSDAVERLLAQLARLEGALDLAIGDGLAALTEGSRLVALGFSCLEDYAREVLDLKERRAGDGAPLARAAEAAA